jgi:hypothetical protein
MIVIKGLLAAIFIVSSLVIAYNHNPRAFCFLAIVIIIQLLFECMENK